MHYFWEHQYLMPTKLFHSEALSLSMSVSCSAVELKPLEDVVRAVGLSYLD